MGLFNRYRSKAVVVEVDDEEDLGAAYSERVTRPRELTTEDQDLVRSLVRSNRNRKQPDAG